MGPSRQGQAVHARHDDVGQEELRPSLFLDDAERILGVGCFSHRIARLLDQDPHKGADLNFIINHQYHRDSFPLDRRVTDGSF